MAKELKKTGNENSETGRQVASFQPPRLPWDDRIAEKFGEIGVSKETWKALVEAVYPEATSVDSVILALSYCRGRKLDPFKRVIHIVPIWDANKRKMVDTIWPGIAEHRTTASRTKQFAGCDPAVFGEMVERSFIGDVKRGQEWKEITVTMAFPEWCSITVYRMVDKQRIAIAGPRVYWEETYARQGRAAVPNSMWQQRPRGQLEKCAEAAALRRAFPEELGNEYTSDEMAGQERLTSMVDVTPPAEPGQASQRPQRALGGAGAEGSSPAGNAATAPAEAQGDTNLAWAIITPYGEEFDCDDVEHFCTIFYDMLQAITDPSIMEGTWESNQLMIDQLMKAEQGSGNNLLSVFLTRVAELKKTDAEEFDQGQVSEQEHEDPEGSDSDRGEEREIEPEQKAKPAPEQQKAAAKKKATKIEVPLYDGAEELMAKHTQLKAWHNGLMALIEEAGDKIAVINNNQEGQVMWLNLDKATADEASKLMDIATTTAQEGSPAQKKMV